MSKRKLLGGGCAIALAICLLCYYGASDASSCSVRGAEFNGVDGYYYASGGRFVQRGNAGLSRLQPVDIFDILNWRAKHGDSSQAPSLYSINLSSREWTINNGRTVLYQSHLAATDSTMSKVADAYLFFPPGPQGDWTLHDSTSASPASASEPSPPRKSSISIECSGRLSASPPTAEQSFPSAALSSPSKPSQSTRSNLQQLVDRPVTTLLLIGLVGYSYVLYSSQTDPSTVSFSYEKIITDGEWYRLGTAACAHFDLMHLGFNTMTLYQLGALEDVYGSVRYAYLNFALVIITGIILLVMSYVMITRMGREDQRFVQAVGYSCVLFAWLMAAAVRMKEFCPVIFFPSLCFKTWVVPAIGLPLNFGPVVLLFLTKVVIPRSSFLGHLSGLLIGIPLAWNLLDWMHPQWIVSFLTSVYLLFAYDRLWFWRNSQCATLKQDFVYFVHSFIATLSMLPAAVTTAAASLGLELPEMGAGQGIRYSTLSVAEEEDAPQQAASRAGEGNPADSTHTSLAVSITSMCVNVDNAWVSLDGFVPLEQLQVYNMFKWTSLVTIASVAFEFFYTLIILWGHVNVFEYVIFNAFPLFLLALLLWSAHQAARISYLTESTPTLQACVHMLTICWLYLVSLAVTQAATAGAFMGSYRMIHVNTSIDTDGRTLASDATFFIAAMNAIMLVLLVCLGVLLVLLLRFVPNVEKGEVLNKMRMTAVAGLFEK